MPQQEGVRGVAVDERLASEPLHGTAPGPVSRNAYQAGSRSGYSSWSSSLNRRKAPLPWIAWASSRLRRQRAPDTDRCPDERFHADEDAIPYVADELSLTIAAQSQQWGSCGQGWSISRRWLMAAAMA